MLTTNQLRAPGSSNTVPNSLRAHIKLSRPSGIGYIAGLNDYRGNRQSRQTVIRATANARTPWRSSPTFKVQLIKPLAVRSYDSHDKLLVYLPGTDGTGQAILPQIPSLHGLGYDVWCLYLPPDDRSDWEQLTTQVTLLLRQLLGHWHSTRPPAAASRRDAAPPRITVVAESFGCCLALRLAASRAGPELLDRLVLVNPATSFNQSLSGLSSLIAATNLLSLFPRDWYAVAQSTLLPLLVDGERVDEDNQRLLQSMVLMVPPDSRESFGYGPSQPPPAASSEASGPDGAAASPAPNDAWARDDASGDNGPLYYTPAAAANFRANLLRSGDPGDEVLRRVEVPVLLVTSARDRLLPSIMEGARLERVLPNARRCILPDSGHAALLERGVDIAAAMQAAGFAGDVVTQLKPPAAAAAASPGSLAPAAEAGARKRRRVASNSAGGAPGHDAPASVPSAGVVDAMSMGQGQSPTDGKGAGAYGYGTMPTATRLGGALAAATVSSSGSPTTPQNGDSAGAGPGWGARSAANGAGSGDGDLRPNGPRRRNRAGGAAGAGEGGGGADEEAPPPDVDSAFDEWCQRLAPWRDVVSPVVLGFEHLPPPGSPEFSRPMLFVGNHQKMGFYDTPLLIYELYVRGYRVRGLAHPGHWAGPFGRFFEGFGAVKASPMAAFRLLRSSEKVLLFPGGAKEVVKKRGQEYKLLWKDTPDFVRLAARCNALIVPFAAVGADDAYDVIMDTDEVVAHPVLGPLTTGLLSRVSSALDPAESIFPITRLPVVGLPTPIPIPNLQRLYFKFSPPIDPRALGTNINDPQQVQELYDGVKAIVTECMSELLAVRETDDESQLGARLTKSLQRIVPALGAAASAPPSTSASSSPPPQRPEPDWS